MKKWTAVRDDSKLFKGLTFLDLFSMLNMDEKISAKDLKFLLESTEERIVIGHWTITNTKGKQNENTKHSSSSSIINWLRFY